MYLALFLIDVHLFRADNETCNLSIHTVGDACVYNGSINHALLPCNFLHIRYPVRTGIFRIISN